MPHMQLPGDKIEVFPLSQRKSFIDIRQEAVDPQADIPCPNEIIESLDRLSARVIAARRCGAAVILDIVDEVVSLAERLVVLVNKALYGPNGQPVRSASAWDSRSSHT